MACTIMANSSWGPLGAISLDAEIPGITQKLHELCKVSSTLPSCVEPQWDSAQESPSVELQVLPALLSRQSLLSPGLIPFPSAG